MIRPFLTLFLLAAVAAGQAPSPAGKDSFRLAPGLWQERQALEREFDASGGRSSSAYERILAIDRQYRRFVLGLSDAYRKRQIAVVDSECDAARGDPEASIFCALVRYRLGNRQDPDRFLAALPETPDVAAALVGLGRAASREGSEAGLAAAPISAVTSEIFRLMVAGSPVATARYFYLLRHSGGAWADDAADQLEQYLADHPEAVIRNWPVLGRYWNLSEGITWDVDAAWWQGILARYRRACPPARPSCGEILALLEKAARAAGSE